MGENLDHSYKVWLDWLIFPKHQKQLTYDRLILLDKDQFVTFGLNKIVSLILISLSSNEMKSKEEQLKFFHF